MVIQGQNSRFSLVFSSSVCNRQCFCTENSFVFTQRIALWRVQVRRSASCDARSLPVSRNTPPSVVEFLEGARRPAQRSWSKSVVHAMQREPRSFCGARCRNVMRALRGARGRDPEADRRRHTRRSCFRSRARRKQWTWVPGRRAAYLYSPERYALREDETVFCAKELAVANGARKHERKP